MSACIAIPPLVAESPPLRVEGGIIRIGNSRVSLDVLIEQYHCGMSPEEFVRAYDSVSLADVHAALGYYLRHEQQVHDYLRSRESVAREQQTAIETDRPRIKCSELIARRQAQELAGAQASE